MNKVIKQAEKIELTGDDLREMTNNECKVMDYLSLEKVATLDQVFGNKNAVILLFNTSNNSGHWVLLIKRGDSSVEHFDPYGFTIDEDLNIANNQMLRNHEGQLTPHLTALIERSGFNVIENKKRLQKLLKDINTCGRHCVLRYLFSDEPINKYIRMMTNQKITPDEIATYFTYLL